MNPKHRYPDLHTGQVFHHWTIIGPSVQKQTKERTRRVNLARCVCGTERMVDARAVQRGKSRSCGCKRPTKCGQKTLVLDGVKVDTIALGLAVARTHLKKGEIPTHDFLAAFCGCSRERIRQIEFKALRKLRKRLEIAGVKGDCLLAA